MSIRLLVVENFTTIRESSELASVQRHIFHGRTHALGDLA